MKAITTKYVGPTNTRGAKVVATDSDGNRASVSYGYEGDARAQHRRAATALCEKMKWGSCDRLVGGGTKSGYAFVFLPSGCSCPSGSLGRSRGPRRRKRRKK